MAIAKSWRRKNNGNLENHFDSLHSTCRLYSTSMGEPRMVVSPKSKGSRSFWRQGAVPVIVDMSYGARMVLYYTLFRQRGYISSENLDTLFSCGIPFNFGRANEEHYGFEHDVSSSGLLKVGNEDEINVLKDAFLVAHGMRNNICGYEWKWGDGSPIEDERAMVSQILSDIAHNLISIGLEGEEDGR